MNKVESRLDRAKAMSEPVILGGPGAAHPGTANIMYEPQADTVKVADFGIARITDSSRTNAGMVLGTPSYMSPEQLAGKKVDGRSDLFSLGAALYHMVSGRLPFEGAFIVPAAPATSS